MVDFIDPIDDMQPAPNSAPKPLNHDVGNGVDISLVDDLALKVMDHRDSYHSWITRRYREILVNIRDYVNLPKSVNKYKLEYWLRSGYDVILGKNAMNITCILGVVRSSVTSTDPQNPNVVYKLNKKNIQWLIKDSLIPQDENFTEITFDDDALTGSFVVLRNKPVTYVNDFEIVDFYANRLSEIMASRYSLIIRSKVSKVIEGVTDDETLNQLVSMNYNGQSFIRANTGLVEEINMWDMGDPNTAELLKTLKQVYNDEMNELNNQLGINTTGINKQSGVSDAEVNSNNDVVSSVSNMYINGVQMGLDLYNKRFDTDYHCYINNYPVEDGVNEDNYTNV